MEPDTTHPGPTLEDFLSGFRAPQMTKKALRQWTVAGLIDRPTEPLLQWVNAENLRVIACVKALSERPYSVRVQWAINNAKKYRAWLKEVRKEVHVLRPRHAQGRRQKGPRVGLLAREAQAFRGRACEPIEACNTAAPVEVIATDEITAGQGDK